MVRGPAVFEVILALVACFVLFSGWRWLEPERERWGTAWTRSRVRRRRAREAFDIRLVTQKVAELYRGDEPGRAA